MKSSNNSAHQMDNLPLYYEDAYHTALPHSQSQQEQLTHERATYQTVTHPNKAGQHRPPGFKAARPTSGDYQMHRFQQQQMQQQFRNEDIGDGNNNNSTPPGQPQRFFPQAQHHNQDHHLNWSRLNERALAKHKELQSCISYLQDNGRMGQLYETIQAIFMEERASQAALLSSQQPSPVSPIDSITILRNNLKEIMCMMIDEVSSSSSIIIPAPQENIGLAPVRTAINCNNNRYSKANLAQSQQQDGMLSSSRQFHNNINNNLDEYALTASNRSLKNSASNHSKCTPASISKMNITELKQSLSQTLNRDFIEPPAQQQQPKAPSQFSARGRGSQQHLVQRSLGNAEIIDYQLPLQQPLIQPIQSFDLVEQHVVVPFYKPASSSQPRKDMVVDDFSSSSEEASDFNESSSNNHFMMMINKNQQQQEDEHPACENVEPTPLGTLPLNHVPECNNELIHFKRAQTASSYHHSQLQSSSSDQGNPPRPGSRNTSDAPSYQNSVHRQSKIIRTKNNPSQSEYYNAGAPMVGNGGVVIRHQQQDSEYNPLTGSQHNPLNLMQTPQYQKFSERGNNPISSPNTTGEDHNNYGPPHIALNGVQQLFRQEQAKQRLLAINLLSQENSCQKPKNISKPPSEMSGGQPHVSSKEAVVALFKYTQNVPPNNAGTNDNRTVHNQILHKQQHSCNMNPVEEIEENSVVSHQQHQEEQTRVFHSKGRKLIKIAKSTGASRTQGPKEERPKINLAQPQSNESESEMKMSQIQVQVANQPLHQSLQPIDDMQMDSKLQEIMLKNIWEIENNPVFNNSNGSRSSIQKDEGIQMHRQNLNYVNLDNQKEVEELDHRHQRYYEEDDASSPVKNVGMYADDHQMEMMRENLDSAPRCGDPVEYGSSPGGTVERQQHIEEDVFSEDNENDVDEYAYQKQQCGTFSSSEGDGLQLHDPMLTSEEKQVSNMVYKGAGGSKAISRITGKPTTDSQYLHFDQNLVRDQSKERRDIKNQGENFKTPYQDNNLRESGNMKQGITKLLLVSPSLESQDTSSINLRLNSNPQAQQNLLTLSPSVDTSQQSLSPSQQNSTQQRLRESQRSNNHRKEQEQKPNHHGISRTGLLGVTASEDSPSNWVILGSQSKAQGASTASGGAADKSLSSDCNQNNSKLSYSQHLPVHLGSTSDDTDTNLRSKKIVLSTKGSANEFHTNRKGITDASTSQGLEQESNSLLNFVHDQQNNKQMGTINSKISAEELIRNYANANFMPQKQINDRLHLLCQSRELNPLVSLTLDNQNSYEPTPHSQPKGSKINVINGSYVGANSSVHTNLDSRGGKHSSSIKASSVSAKSSTQMQSQNAFPLKMSVQNGGTAESLRIEGRQGIDSTAKGTQIKTPTSNRAVSKTIVGYLPERFIKKSRNTGMQDPKQHAQSVNNQYLRSENDLLAQQKLLQHHFMTVASADSRIVTNKISGKQGSTNVSKKSKSSGGGNGRKQRNTISSAGSRKSGGINKFLTKTSQPRSIKQNDGHKNAISDSPGFSMGSLDSNGNKLRYTFGNSLKQLGFNMSINKQQQSDSERKLHHNNLIQLNLAAANSTSRANTQNTQISLSPQKGINGIVQKRHITISSNNLKIKAPDFKRLMTAPIIDENIQLMQQSQTERGQLKNQRSLRDASLDDDMQYQTLSPYQNQMHTNNTVYQGQQLRGLEQQQHQMANIGNKAPYAPSLKITSREQNSQSRPQQVKQAQQQRNTRPQQPIISPTSRHSAPMNPQAIIYGKLLQKHQQSAAQSGSRQQNVNSATFNAFNIQRHSYQGNNSQNQQQHFVDLS